MKGKIFIILFLLLTAVIFSQTLDGVLFLNSTGYDITKIYISPTSHDDWYDNMLNGQSVGDGETISINIPEYEDSEFLFDAMAVDVDGDEYYKYEIDLSNPNSRSIEFTFDDYDDENSDEDYDDSSYDARYFDGYRDAFRDAYSEAFKEGFSAGYEASLEMNK